MNLNCTVIFYFHFHCFLEKTGISNVSKDESYLLNQDIT